MTFVKVESNKSSAWNSKDSLQNGDSIVGYLTNVEHNVGAKKNSTLYTLQTDTGEEKVWGSVMLDDLMSVVEIGTKIKIVFVGKKSSKSGGNYNVYELYIDEEATPLDIENKEDVLDVNSEDFDEDFSEDDLE